MHPTDQNNDSDQYSFSQSQHPQPTRTTGETEQRLKEAILVHPNRKHGKETRQDVLYT